MQNEKWTIKSKSILVTGAAGFIGSSFIRETLQQGYKVVVLDALTYAGHFDNLKELISDRCEFVHGNIQNIELLQHLFQTHHFESLVHFAAESHVDNSISGPRIFMETNVMGTFALLEAARSYYQKLNSQSQSQFRFLHVSTDEVFGSLGETGKFHEQTPYAPNSPYSSSKASSDMLVRAWFHTYGLPTIITNCSNNYGPRQFPEKLIPRMIDCALNDQALPVYGNGKNVRDWIHVEDHARGVLLALQKGSPGQCYCLGGNSERSNIDVVQGICKILDQLAPRKDGASHASKIKYVEDRQGHDFRYAIDDSYAQKELGFRRTYENFEKGLLQTVQWYLDNQNWVQSVKKRTGKS